MNQSLSTNFSKESLAIEAAALSQFRCELEDLLETEGVLPRDRPHIKKLLKTLEERPFEEGFPDRKEAIMLYNELDKYIDNYTLDHIKKVYEDIKGDMDTDIRTAKETMDNDIKRARQKPQQSSLGLWGFPLPSQSSPV